MSEYQLHKRILSEAAFELVVAGGGPAGFAAAVSAARQGARTLLVESTTALGGMATVGLVTSYDGMGDGEKCLVGGVMREICETLYVRGWMPENERPAKWREKYLCPTKVKPEELKLHLDEMAAEAGVTVRFQTKVADVELGPDGRSLRGVIVHGVDGLRHVPARCFIDATGDAAVAAAAGAECRVATVDTPAPMPATLCFILANIDESRAENPRHYGEQALADGHFSQPEVRLVPSRIGPGIFSFNAGHVFGRNFVDPVDLSEAIMLGRRIVYEHVTYLRKYVPGYERCELVATAPLLGVRESRRIVGEYELTWGDYADGRQFPDQIAVYNKEVDQHAYSCDPEVLAEHRRHREAKVGWLPPGACYGIPYGCIVPRGWANLWVPGRSGSFDILSHASARVMPAASMMGEAAGVAAVQALRQGQRADDLNTETLVRTLREQGAYLPQTTLSPTMTRGRGAEQPANPLCRTEVPPDFEASEPAAAKAPQPSPMAPRTPEPAAGMADAPWVPKEGSFAQRAEALLLRACGEIERNCCQSQFTDADDYVAAVRAQLVEAAVDEPRRLWWMVRELRGRLEGGCCHSSLTRGLEIAEAAEQLLADAEAEVH